MPYLLSFQTLILLAALCLSSAPSLAAGTKKTDPFLQKAIHETAATPVTAPVQKELPPPLSAPTSTLEPAPLTEEDLVAQPVITREHPEFKPMGIVAKGYLFIPSLSLEQKYDNNILAATAQEQDDFITALTPALHVELQGSRHEMEFEAAYEVFQFWDHSDENSENFTTGLNGVLEARQNVKIPYKFSYDSVHEKREDDLAGLLPREPLKQETFLAETGLDIKPGRLGLKVLGRYKQDEFEDGRTPVGVSVIRSDSDREAWEGETSVSYDLNPVHTVSLTGQWGQTNYDKRTFQGGAFTGPRRDNDRYGLLAGWKRDYKGIVISTVKLGYEKRDYDSATINNIEDLAADIDIAWNMSDITTLNLAFQRTTLEDKDIISGIRSSKTSISIDHELRKNIILGILGEHDYRDFENLNREDETLRLRALARYTLNPHVSLSGEYEFTTRDSNLRPFQFERDIFLVRLTGQM